MKLLIDRASHTRVEEALAARSAVEALIMEDDGQVVDARGNAVSDPKPEAGWLSSSVLITPGGPLRPMLHLLLDCPETRWVQSGAAGFEHPIFQRLLDRGIRLSANDASSIAIAEYVLGEVLAACQPFAERREAQAERSWRRLPFRELAGSRWVILGYGSIGREVAARAQAFGASVVGVRRTPQAHDPHARVVGLDALHEEVAQADVLVVCASANASNQHIINAELLAQLPPGNLLVNVARGSLVDEDALLAALDAGRPALAVLDVFETEPLPEDNALWAHPRVRVTAHCSAQSAGSGPRGDIVFLEHLDAWLADQPLRLEVTGKA